MYKQGFMPKLSHLDFQGTLLSYLLQLVFEAFVVAVVSYAYHVGKRNNIRKNNQHNIA